MIDVQSSVKAVSGCLSSATEWKGESLSGKSLEQLAQILQPSIQNYQAYSERYCSQIDPKLGAGFIKTAFPADDDTTLASKWGKILDILNVDLYRECEDDLKAAEEGVIGRLRFNRLEEHGPKMGAISAK